MRRWVRPELAAALLLAAAAPARAAPGDWVDSIRPIASPPPLAETPLPVGRPRATPAGITQAWAQDRTQRMIYDVASPSLIALPAPPRAAGAAPPAAVILVPGGGFEFLSIDNEGFQVARRLAPLGVRVFILKYRTLLLPGGFEGFRAALRSTFEGEPAASGPIDITQDLPFATADAQASLREVRAHADRWGVDPRRIALVGFSAGAMTALATVQADAPGARPDAVALIYGPTKTAPAPAHAPPLFDALAADDRFFGHDDLGLIEAWRRSGGSVEFHLYSGGGHGFASQPNGTTSDDWFDAFSHWLRAQGFASPARAVAQAR